MLGGARAAAALQQHQLMAQQAAIILHAQMAQPLNRYGCLFVFRFFLGA
jgi:hypothetical protein